MMKLSNLNRLKHISVPLQTDERGFVGRECPVSECRGYFKIKFGTGLKGEDLPCHCPYCGHVAPQEQFATDEQVQYARSIAIRKIQDALKLDVKSWDQELRRNARDSFVKLRVDFKGQRQPIRYYCEKELETTVVCDKCTLEYAVYGVFAYCPDCGMRNSLQMLGKNLELAEKELNLAGVAEAPEFSAFLVADALENVVSAFDGFGREICRIHSDKAANPERVKRVSFQNLRKARDCVKDEFGFDLAGNRNASDWSFCVTCFQKRHLLSHTMGVIDQQYIDITKDQYAVVGRKIEVESVEVSRFIQLLTCIATDFINHFSIALPDSTD